MGPSVIVPLRELFLCTGFSLSNMCICPKKAEAITHKEMVGEKLGVGNGSPVEPMMLVVFKGPVGFAKLGVGKESPVEPMMLVVLKGPVGFVKLGVDKGSPVEPTMLVILKGPIEFVRFGVDVGSLILRLGVGTGSPVEPMMLVILTELKGGIEGVGILEIEVERLNERVGTVDTEKPELGRVGIWRVIELSIEISVVEMKMVLRDVRLFKGGTTV